MVKKTKLEKIETLDRLCQQSSRLANLYKKEKKKFPTTSIERLFFDKIASYYGSIAYGSCSLFDIATEVSHTEYLPREMVEIEDYKEFIKKERSTD